MTRLSTTPLGTRWLELFDDIDERATAALLIDEVLLVSRNDLTRGLRHAIETIPTERDDAERPIALFAERAVYRLTKSCSHSFQTLHQAERQVPAYRQSL